MRAALESDRAMVSEKGKVQKKRKKISSGFAILGWVGQGSELKSREIASRVMKKILRFIGPAKKQKCGNCNIFLEILQQFFVAFVFCCCVNCELFVALNLQRLWHGLSENTNKFD